MITRANYQFSPDDQMYIPVDRQLEIFKEKMFVSLAKEMMKSVEVEEKNTAEDKTLEAGVVFLSLQKYRELKEIIYKEVHSSKNFNDNAVDYICKQIFMFLEKE